MARKVVLADASPLISLARAGGLPWLRKLYKTISITKQVRGEATGARELPGAVAIAAAVKQGWIRVLRQEWSEPPLPQLDTGEASTLRAAIGLGPGTLVLLDDLQARREAQEQRMETKIVAIGNSRGVRLPRAAIEKSGLAPGAPLEVTASAGRIVLEQKTEPNRRAGWEAQLRRAGAGRVRENLWGDVPVDEPLDR